jgi:DNA-3-methyladenine glycosylase I
MTSCTWPGTDPMYIDYHDTEWGVPEWDSRALWEKLILDGFQAGLSWITILKKRDAFREAFEGFHPEIIAKWGEEDVLRLLANPGIVRHRGKIEGTIKSANAYLKIDTEKGFSNWLWPM